MADPALELARADGVGVAEVEVAVVVGPVVPGVGGDPDVVIAVTLVLTGDLRTIRLAPLRRSTRHGRTLEPSAPWNGTSAHQISPAAGAFVGVLGARWPVADVAAAVEQGGRLGRGVARAWRRGWSQACRGPGRRHAFGGAGRDDGQRHGEGQGGGGDAQPGDGCRARHPTEGRQLSDAAVTVRA